MHAAANIGRVGGLALALGVGAILVAGGSGVASAAPEDDATSAAGSVGAGPRTSAPPRSHSASRARAANPSAARSARVAAVAALPARTVASPSPGSPVEVVSNWVVASAASVITRPQPGAPAAPSAAVTTAPSASRSAAATADTNPIATFFFNQTPIMTPGADATLGRVVTGQLNGYDPDSAPLSYTLVTPPANGSVTIDTAGNYTYIPSPTMGRTGYVDSFTVSVSDADTGFHIHGLLGLINMLTFGLLGESGHTTRSTVSVSVPAGNTAPTVTLVVRNPDPITGLVAGAIIGSDADADPLTYSASSAPYGSVNLNSDGTFTYTPTPQARHDAFFSIGPTGDAFVIDVSDGYGNTAVPVAVGIAPAGVTFTFLSYDSDWTTDAQGAMNLAARSLASYFVVNAPMTITLDGISDTSDPQNLAYASTDFANGGPNGFYYTVPQSKVITGHDTNGALADAVISFNWSQPWYLGNPSVPGVDSVPAGQFDFKAVAIHELMHTVGFLSGAQTPLGADRSWTVYDGFLSSSNGTTVIDPATRAIKAGYQGNFTGSNGGLYFTGPNAGSVRLYTPGTFSAGSSISHVNGLPNYVMNPSSSTGPGTRQLNPVEVGILKDIGYQVSTSPWVAAFVLVFVRIRRRRR